MNNLKLDFVALSLVFLLTVSCHKSMKQDLSLTPKEYLKLGMPDPSKSWTIYDCVYANLTLSSLHRINPLFLPRKNSKKSAAYFNKLIDKKNLSFVNDTAFPLRNRAFLIQHFQKLQNELRNLYTDKTKEEQYYNEELIDMYIFGLFLQENMLVLSEKIMNSKLESDIEIQYGQKTVLNNYVRMISMLLGEQLKSRVYSRNDLDRLSEEISHSVIKNVKWLTPENKEKIKIQIQDAFDKSTSGFAKNNYRKALEEMKKINP
jgi:hypothetical protein